MRVRPLAAGMAGGLVAGAVLGLVEAIAVWWLSHGGGGGAPVPWALLAYGLVGAAAGAGIGGVAALVGREGFAPAVALVCGILGIVVWRFRIVRDVFLEQPPAGIAGLAWQGLVVAIAGAVGVVLWRALRGADERRRLLTRPAGALTAVVLAAGAWGVGERVLTPAPPPPEGPRRTAPAGAPPIVLIAVDTLRADHLGVYGYGPAKTPHIDQLARDGIRAAHAFAQSSWTRPSFATIFTSLYPSSHGAIHKVHALPDRVETLAEVLLEAGWYTVGFPNNVNITPAFNFQQGFAEYSYLAPELFFWAGEAATKLTLYNGLRLVRQRFFARRLDPQNYYQPAETVTDVALAWLAGARAREPFFLFVHYMDPHDPYFVHPFNGEGYARVANPNPPASLADRYRQLYDGEIAYLDAHIGRLLDGLRARDLYERAMIVLVADHGEEFHDHGGWWHGTTLYDEQIHVPLIVKPPGSGVRDVVLQELVTTLDVMPTILAAVGVTGPSIMQGHALPLDGTAAPTRESVFAEEDLEGNVLQAVRTRSTKLITANPGNPRGLAPEELYDLVADPKELQNLAARERALLEEMRAALGRSFLAARAHAGAVSTTDVDSATKDRLRALGYLD